MSQSRLTSRWGRFFSLVIFVVIIGGGGFMAGLIYGQKAELARRLADPQAVLLGKLSGLYQQDKQGRLRNYLRNF